MKLLIPVLVIALLAGSTFAAKKKASPAAQTALDRYVTDAKARSADAPAAAPGGIWTPGSRLADAARDVRASQIDDMITILVVENASAVASGTTKTGRTSSTANSISALAGITKATGPWNNLAGVTGNTQINGQGTTSRDVVISTTLTARVSSVLPNGTMLVEATKDLEVNSERQTITVRGIVRPADVGSDNTVRSDHLGQLELRVNGKGVVGDAIRRPFILYRLLLGLLPF
ncbi:MAG: flagellar basal body L-ring protein FlgH [Candidatus Solibacter sp.]|jgi:flagellar L-ring protein precursor FlgH